MDAEYQVHVQAMGLIVTAFFRQKERPVRTAAVGVVDGDLLQRPLGESGKRQEHGKAGFKDGSEVHVSFSITLTRWLCYALAAVSSLKSFFALSSKISFFSSALSQSKPSII